MDGEGEVRELSLGGGGERGRGTFMGTFSISLSPLLCSLSLSFSLFRSILLNEGALLVNICVPLSRQTIAYRPQWITHCMPNCIPANQLP